MRKIRTMCLNLQDKTKKFVDPFNSDHVLGAVAATIVQATLVLIYKEKIKTEPGLLMLFAAIYVFISLSVLTKTNNDVRNKLRMLGLTSEWIADKDFFPRMAKMIGTAEEEILAVGMYFQKREDTEIKIPFEDDRENYLKSIERQVKKHLARYKPGDPRFTYERIMLLNDPTLDKHGYLDWRKKVREEPNQEGPSQMEEHYVRLSNILAPSKKNGSGNNQAGCNIGLHVCIPIPSLTSIVIVDRKRAFLTFPTLSRQISRKVGKFFRVELAGALYFEDAVGDQIGRWAVEIDKIIKSSSNMVTLPDPESSN